MTGLTPDEFGQWLNQSANRYRFRQLMPLANRETKLTKTDPGDEQAVFGLYSMGVVTNRDEWVYDFDADNLGKKVRTFINLYEESRAEYGGQDVDNETLGTTIKWTRDLKRQLRLDTPNVYDRESIRRTLFRPFIYKSLYFNQNLNEMQYQLPDVFGLRAPPEKTKRYVSVSTEKTFTPSPLTGVADLHFTGDTQCLPLYRYTAEGQRVSNITEWAVREFNEHCREVLGDYFQEFFGDGDITAEDIFAYVYAVLHDPVYRHDYEADLLREFPRLPFYKDFPDWVRMGRELLDLHLGFETIEPYPLERVEQSGPAGKPILRADKEKGAIVLDAKTTLTGIPESAWRYRLGSRSALEWVLDQYKERKPRDPTIAAKFNAYRFANHKENVIDLLRRVCAVSIQTMDLVDDMAWLLESGHLGVYGDRDEYEWGPQNPHRPRHQWLYGPASVKRDGAWSET